MANRSRRSGFAKKIEVVHWTLIQESIVGIAAAGVSGRAASAAQHLPETILRIRGEWACSYGTNLADGIGSSITAGLILVPEGTGTTVLWSPNTDGDAPWIWWDVLNLIYREFVTDVNWSSNCSDGRRVIDSKAMRKVRNQELQLVVENQTATGLTGGSVDMVMTARVLAGS